MVAVVIRYKTRPAASWTPAFIVRTLFNDTITVAVWTSVHVSLHSFSAQNAKRKPSNRRRYIIESTVPKRTNCPRNLSANELLDALGTMAIAANAQTQAPGAGSLDAQIQNATPIHKAA